MRLSKQHLDAIGTIYDAVLNPGKWPEVLDSVVGHVGATGATLVVSDQSPPEFRLLATNSFYPPDVLREYQEHYAESDGEALRTLLNYPPCRLVSDVEALKHLGPLDQLPTVSWLKRKYGVFHRAAARLHDKGIWFDAVGVHYHADRGPITDRERRTGDLFLPHLAKVVELNRPFRALMARFQAVLSVLDRFHTGILFLSHKGNVILNNREAERILDLKDGLCLDAAGKPSTPFETDRRALCKAIERATATADGRDNHAETMLAVKRRSGRDALLVEVCPLRDECNGLAGRLRGAILFVIDPTHLEPVSTDGIGALYHLTSAESDVCRLLAEGHSSRDMADIRNVTPETIRGQIKTVLHKTRTTSRSQLVRLALSVNLPIDKVESPQDANI